MGKSGCRYLRPYPTNEKTDLVKLIPRPQLEDGTYDSNDGGNDDQCWIAKQVEISSTWATRSPIDPIDRTIYYYELVRPTNTALALPFEGFDKYMNGEMVLSDLEKEEKKVAMLQKLVDASPLLEKQMPYTEVRRLDMDSMLDLYLSVSQRIIRMNGFVVEHSPLLSYLTGSHNNAAFLGSNEQGKGATFYLGPYFAKEKVALEESLQIMMKANQHINTYPSTADDSGARTRQTKYFLQRCLNRHGTKMELSDAQVAAALLGMPVILRASNTCYIDPYAS